MVERQVFRAALAAHTGEPVGVQEAEPVEGEQSALDARCTSPAVVPAYQTASLADTTRATETKRLRLPAPSILTKGSLTDLAEGSWHLDHVAHVGRLPEI